MSNNELTNQDWQRKQAVQAFNATWDLMDKTDRTDEETLKMIHLAHASRYHWGEIGTNLEFARGEWQISRVYAIINCPERALFHAKASLNYCKVADIQDFDLAFAYEALARSYSLLNQNNEYDIYYNLALIASDNISDEGDKSYFLNELNSIKKF